MPTCIRVFAHNFILMFVPQCVNSKKPFLNERATIDNKIQLYKKSNQ